MQMKACVSLGGNEAYITAELVSDVLVLGGSALGLEYSGVRSSQDYKRHVYFPHHFAAVLKDLIMYSCIEKHKGKDVNARTKH